MNISFIAPISLFALSVTSEFAEVAIILVTAPPKISRILPEVDVMLTADAVLLVVVI